MALSSFVAGTFVVIGPVKDWLSELEYLAGSESCAAADDPAVGAKVVTPGDLGVVFGRSYLRNEALRGIWTGRKTSSNFLVGKRFATSASADGNRGPSSNVRVGRPFALDVYCLRKPA